MVKSVLPMRTAQMISTIRAGRVPGSPGVPAASRHGSPVCSAWSTVPPEDGGQGCGPRTARVTPTRLEGLRIAGLKHKRNKTFWTGCMEVVVACEGNPGGKTWIPQFTTGTTPEGPTGDGASAVGIDNSRQGQAVSACVGTRPLSPRSSPQ